MDGNTILITGGASGIGFEFAKQFMNRDNTVVVVGRRAAALEAAKEQLHGIETIQADLEIAESREALFNTVTRDFPELNVVVNNAGVQQHPPRLTRPQDWAKHAQEIQINLAAPIHLSMLFAPHLLKQERAAIINITSGLSFVPLVYVPTYSATKAALHSFTQSLRYQLQETAIEVYECAPPAVDTDLGGPGKHTFGVPVTDFVSASMEQLAKGTLEFGYQMSEEVRTADPAKREAILRGMNERMGVHFPGY